MKTRRRVSLLLLASLLSFAPLAAPLLRADEKKADTPKRGMQNRSLGDTGKKCLWRITDEDSTVFLAGSVHLLRPKDSPHPAAYDRAYEASEEVVFEVDMAEMEDPANKLRLVQLGQLPEGESIEDHLSEEAVARLRAYLVVRGMPPAAFDQFKPGMISLTIAAMEAMKVGARPDLGLETVFFAKCEEDGKPSRGLETPEFQVKLFDELDSAEMEKVLIDTLDEAEKTAKALDAMIRAWKDGDLEALGELVEQGMESSEKFRELLLVERNANWVPEIEKALASDRNVLFLVGAGHLIGEDSVISMLAEKGIEAEQVGLADLK